MMLPNDDRNVDLANACKLLLAQRQSGQITQSELEKELCYVSIKYCMDDLRKKKVPLDIPTLLAIYQNYGPLEKKAFLANNPSFFKDGEVWDYLEAKDRVEHTNLRNKAYLQGMVETFNKLGDKKNEEIAYSALATHT